MLLKQLVGQGVDRPATSMLSVDKLYASSLSGPPVETIIDLWLDTITPRRTYDQG